MGGPVLQRAKPQLSFNQLKESGLCPGRGDPV